MKKTIIILLSLLLLTGCMTNNNGNNDTDAVVTDAEFPGKVENTDMITWYSGDLSEVMRLSAQYVGGLLDRDLDYEPFFGIHGQGDGVPVIGIHALEIGIPHVTGRGIDCLFNIESATGVPVDAFVEEVYRRFFYSCMDELGLPAYYRDGKPYVTLHNLRESCEALAWLIRSRDDNHSKEIADRFLTQLTAVMPSGRGIITDSGTRTVGLNGILQGSYNSPETTGRLVGALLNLYNAYGDERAYTLAGEIAENAFTWFDDDGAFAACGTHVHSITSTLSGILEYAYAERDRKLVDLVRAVYDSPRGMGRIMSSYGWIKEQVFVPNTLQGESNQIGDIIQVQLLFGKNELAERAYWYGRAETFMRSALLPSQVLENDFFTVDPDPKEDRHADMRERSIGGFGFPMPTSHLQFGGSALNTVDITQGAIQATAYLTKHIAYVENNELWVNLLFDHSNEYADIESLLPLEGKIQITPKINGTLRVRAYDNIGSENVRVYVNGMASAFELQDGYIVLPGISVGDKVYVDFDIKSSHKSEIFYPETDLECVYEVYYYGEQVVAVTPVSGIYPLYANWPLPIEGLN